MTADHTRLWLLADLECLMVSCCAGAELQVRRGGEIIVRELYPSKSDLYERARTLQEEYAREDGRRPPKRFTQA